jgi:hypothetical protein
MNIRQLDTYPIRRERHPRPGTSMTAGSETIMSCATLLFAISLGSAHINAGRHYRGQNQGASIQCDRIEGGAYKNSLGRDSVFLGLKDDWLMGGFVSGYMKLPVPYVAVYYDIGPAEVLATPLLENDSNGNSAGIVLAVRVLFDLSH